MSDVVVVSKIKGYADDNKVVYLDYEQVLFGLGFTKKDNPHELDWELINSYTDMIPNFSLNESYINEDMYNKLCEITRPLIDKKFTYKMYTKIIPEIRKHSLMKNYINYHKHDDGSNMTIADSSVTIDDYVDRALHFGHKVLTCVNHGISYSWTKTYLACKKAGIKFVFGTEAYMSYEDKGSYHVILLAKNQKGKDDINDAISEAVINNFHNRRPKLTLDIIKQFIDPMNVVCTTSCVAGILAEESMTLFHGLREYFKSNFYLEIQANNTNKQITLNKALKVLSKKYNIPLIAATDSHFIIPEQAEDRQIVLDTKRIKYDDDEDENGWYMDYPDYDTLVQRFLEQGVFTKDEIIEAIDRTNMVNDFEDITINTELKVPIPPKYRHLSESGRRKALCRLMDKKWKAYSERNVSPMMSDIYLKEICKEMEEWFECHMQDYALVANEILERGIEYGGVITKTGRGCFVANTQVLTMNGYKNIQDVVIGDTIINKFGKFDKVINTLNYNISEKLTTIKSLGNKDITLTDDHKVYVYDSNLNDFYYIESKKIDKKVHFLTTPINAIGNKIKTKIYDLSNYSQDYFEEDVIYENIKGSQKEIRDIFSPTQMSEDKICGVVSNWKYRNNLIDENTDLYRTIYNYTKMNPSEYSEYLDKYNNTRTIKRFIENDSELMFMLGLILGDGNIHKDKNYISIYFNSIGIKDKISKPRVLNFLERYSINFSLSKVPNKNLNIIQIKSKTFKDFILNEFQIYKNNEKYIDIEKIISNNSKENLIGLLDGLMLSDGSYEIAKDCISTRYNFDSTSKYLTVLFNILCHNLLNKPTSRSKDNRYSGKSIKTRTNRKDFFLKGNYICSKIKSVESTDVYNGLVYDLTIENDPSFMVENAIVHNSCSSFLTNMLLGFSTVDRLKAKVPLLMPRFMTADKVIKGHTTPDTTLIK